MIKKDYTIVFAVVAEKLYRSSCLDKVRDSLSGLLFGETGFYACVDDGFQQQAFFHISDHVHTLEAEIEIVSRKGRNIHNDISAVRIWGWIDGYALPILVLLEKINDSKGFRTALEQYHFF